MSRFVSSTRRLLTVQAVILLQLQLFASQALPQQVNIGIIGGGIGGGAASYYLRQLFGANAKIDIYEAKKVGGRLATVEVDGRYFEAGGSIIHERNRYMRNFAKLLDLKDANSPGGRLGLYDGTHYAFKESSFAPWNYFNLLFRYGFSMFRWNTLMEDMLNKFDNIYAHQDAGYSFTTVAELLSAMDPKFDNMTLTTTSQFLEELGFGRKFINELGLAVTRVNYGQTTAVNGFVGCISLAAAQPNLWAVEGGNYQLVKGAINKSEATLMRSLAKTLTLTKSGKYSIETGATTDENNNVVHDIKRHEYDIVVIAAPQTSDLATVAFKGFPQNVTDFTGRYHRTVATYVKGKLNYRYFGLTDESDVEDVVTINTNLVYNSISKVYPVDWKKDGDFAADVYKIFSQDVLSEDSLNCMFDERKQTQVVDWLAYPHYTPPEQLGSFKLFDRLYYTSAIEWAGSAMEMSAVGGRNVALLAYNQWHKTTGKIDSPEVHTQRKEEL